MTDRDTFLATGRDVIACEAAALTLLQGSLGESFAEAVELILNTKGRVIVSGIGKSGHIGRKIASTLASTGTPAHFVHPAEASHGDLGMMARGDLAMVLSKSGETAELANLVAYTRRFNIPLIGVAEKLGSTLLTQADVALTLPPAPEACGTGVVPTTSATMTLVLGDALAMALMKHRRFTPDKFREFHPGGSLGAQLARVQDLMHAKMPLVPAGTPMSDALIVISQAGFGVVGVLDSDERLAGIVTDGDLRRNMAGLLERNVDEVMNPAPRTIAPNALAEEAVAEMNRPERPITCLFVIDPEAGRPIGILHIHDCLRAGIV